MRVAYVAALLCACDALRAPAAPRALRMSPAAPRALRMSAAPPQKRVVVVGAGWGGLSAAWKLSKEPGVSVTVVDAQARAGGLVADGFRTPQGRKAEAGMHGFWGLYANVFAIIGELGLDDALSGYAEQGQYSPRGLEAVWPVYRAPGRPQLPTGLGQALFTTFT